MIEMKLVEICTIVFDTFKGANVESLAKGIITCCKCNLRYLYLHQAGN